MSLYNIFPNLEQLQSVIIQETWVTIKMVVIAGFIGFIIGLIIACCLVLTRKDGLSPNKYVYTFLNGLINLLRSMPFVIMLVAIIPITKFLVGSPLSFAGVIVPLVVSCSPFYARQFESAMLDVPEGVIEAALAMGANDFEILFRVYIPEALPSIVRATVMTLINLLGLTTMVGVIAGGGIGDLSLMYGLNRGMRDIIYIAIIIILILVYLIQLSGNIVLKIINRGEK